jgi:hypothetical protein
VFYFTELKGKDATQNLDVIETALYTAPPRKEWVSLSDDQMNECIKTADYNQGQYKRTPYWAHLAAAIEAKLKEKNGGS